METGSDLEVQVALSAPPGCGHLRWMGREKAFSPLLTVPPLPSFHFLDFNHIKQVPEGPLDCALGVGVGYSRGVECGPSLGTCGGQ